MKNIINAMQNLIYGGTRLILTEKQIKNTRAY